MPGIAGFISVGDVEQRDVRLDQMVACMMRERFYTNGTLINKELGVAIGWVGHMGSFADCLPIWNEQKDLCLIFSGEHFTDNVDLEKLRKQGRKYSAGDARWLLQLYEENSSEFFEKLNGTFSGFLIDNKNRKAILFNDRYGLNRIYYHESPDGFYFASEAKSLLKVLPQLRRLDMTSFAEFFSCGSALQNRSLFSGVRLLPGASLWTFASAAVRKESYFSKNSWENLPRLPALDYYEKLNETFARILPRYFAGEQPIGLSLTGGLDSRMIVAAMPIQARSMPCYTFGGMYRECADVRLARQIAQACELSHDVIPVTAKFFSEFADLARQSVYCSDGAMDVLGSVELFVNRIAREIAPVRMTGNYGSEVLRANVAFKPVELCKGMFNSDFALLTSKAANTYADERDTVRMSFIAFKQVPWHHYARMAVENTQLTLRSPFLDNDLVAVAYQAPPELSVNRSLAHRFIAEHKPTLASIPTDRGVVGTNGAVAGRMAVFRQEFMPRLEYLFDYGMPQWLARIDRAVAPLHIDRLLLGRQKFYHFRSWYRDELSDYVKEVLLDPRTLGRPYLSGRRVEEIVRAHVEGRGNYTLEIHKLLTSELIQRQLVEQN